MGNTICSREKRERKRGCEQKCKSSSNSSFSSSDTSSVGSNEQFPGEISTNNGTTALRKYLELVEAMVEEFNRRYPTIWNVHLPPDIQCEITLQDAIAILSRTGLVVVTEIKFMPMVHEIVARIYKQMPHTVAPNFDRTTYNQLQTTLSEAVGKCKNIINELKRRGVPVDEDLKEIRRKTRQIQSPEEVLAAAVLTKASIAALVEDVNPDQLPSSPLIC